MATPQSDGSIILHTRVNTDGVNKGMNSIKGSVGKIGGLMAAAFSVKAIASFAKESVSLYKTQMQNEVKLATVMRERVNATNDQIQAILDLTAVEQQNGIIGDEVQIAGLQQLATFAKQTETIETLLPAMNNLIAQQYGFEASTGSAVNVANLMGKVLQGQTGALTRVGITFTEAQEQVLKYGTESERAATLAQVITDNVGEMNKALAKTDVGRQQQLANTMGDIKEQFGEAINQIAIVFLPLLQWLAETLQKIAKVARLAASNIANAFGAENNENQWEKIGEATEETADNIGDQVDAQEDLNKAMKKTLAGFDDLQILSDKTASNQEEELGGGGFFGAGIGEADGSSVVEEVDETTALIMGIVGFALAAIGIILLCFGQITWGIGFLIAGAGIFTVSQAAISGGLSEEVQNTLNTILAIAGGALLVLGIILVATGVALPLGIGLIIAGAAGLATVVALNWDAIVDWIKGAWEAVKGFWNRYIAPIFTAAFWLDLARICGNGLIAGFEGAINGIIWLFEGLINLVVDGLNLFTRGISTVTGAVGDLIGINLRIPEIPKATLGRVSIPRLAKGAVIPPNREFLAVLGDQRQGTNIETPLDTMVQAFQVALDSRGGYNGGNIEVVLELNGRELGRAIVEQGNRESRRIGTRLVVV